MAATAARSGVMSLTRRIPPTASGRHFDLARSVGQAGLASRCFSVKACASSLSRPSIRSMYDAPTFSSARAFSLWPSIPFAQGKTAAESTTVEPSPDARASQTEQVGDINSTSAPDISAFETSTGPTIHDMGSDLSEAVEHVQTLADLGRLSSWPNVRFVQALLDGTVEMTGLPWWATIALVTLSIRILILPLVFKGQANAIRLQNIQPKMGVYMKDIQYAKTTGNKVLLSESAIAVQKLMKDNNCSPFKSLLTPAILMPIFASFFFGLRGLASAGITSMQTGGVSWFTDLTVPDPYYVLPLISVAMTLLVIETGAEMGSTQAATNPQARLVRNVIRGLTVISLPILVYFPAAVFCYMATNNTFSLLQLLALQTPAIRKTLNLPEKIVHEKNEDKAKPMGFWDSVKAGGASQTSANAVSRNRVPSALQNSRQLEEGREAALQKIMEQSQPRTQQPTINASSSLDAGVGSNVAQSTSSLVKEQQVDPLQIDSQFEPEEVDRLARTKEKQRRVHLARQKRAKKQ